MSIQNNFPALKPTLLLDFANTEELDSRITFTRASTATYFDQFGVMQTAASGVARFDHNPTTFESLGLLIEESRTNLLLNSATLSTQNVTVTTVATTLSFYGTGTVTLSGTASGTLVGTGASPSRVSLTFTPTAGTLTLTVSGSVVNAQLEAGAFATSYIPTVASQVTRAADTPTITGTNFSSWYNNAQGTLYSEASTYDLSSGGRTGFSVNDGTPTNRTLTGHGTVKAFISKAGNTQYTNSFGGVTVTNNVASRVALAYASNNVNAAVNGVIGGVDDTVVEVPVVTQSNIGSIAGASSSVNGTIRKIAYYPIRLTNAQLQALTS
jgi:hypothetical protein